VDKYARHRLAFRRENEDGKSGRSSSRRESKRFAGLTTLFRDSARNENATRSARSVGSFGSSEEISPARRVGRKEMIKLAIMRKLEPPASIRFRVLAKRHAETFASRFVHYSINTAASSELTQPTWLAKSQRLT